ERMLFKEYLSKSEDGTTVSFVEQSGLARDLREGTFLKTGNDLDIALQGNGYFTLQSPNGPRYGRAGSFGLNENNELVDRNGFQVLDETGRPITIPAGAKEITVTRDGTIITENGQAGKLGVVKFENEQGLQKAAGN